MSLKRRGTEYLPYIFWPLVFFAAFKVIMWTLPAGPSP